MSLATLPLLEVRSEIPGRVRWQVRGLLGQPYLGVLLERVLRRVTSMLEAVANPVTGRLLVRFGEEVSRTEIELLVARVVQRFERRRGPGSSRRSARAASAPSLGVAGVAGMDRRWRRVRRWIALALSAPMVIAGLAVGASPLAIGAGVVALNVALHRLTSLARPPAGDPAASAGRDPWQPLVDAVWASRVPLGWSIALGAVSITLSLAPFAILGLGLSIATGALTLPTVLGVTISPPVAIAALAAVGFALTIAHAAAEYGAQILWRNTGETIMHRLRMLAFEHAQRAEASYFIHESPGTVLSRLGEDINQIEKVFNAAWEFLEITMGLGLAGGALMATAPSFTWLVLLLVPAFVYVTSHLRDRLIPLYQHVRHEAARLTAEMASSFDGLVTIKSFAAEDRQIARISDQSHRMRVAARPAITVGATFHPIFEIVVMSGIVLVAVAGGVTAGSVGDFSLYASMVMLVRQLLWPLSQLGLTLEKYQRGLASYRRALSVLDIPVEQLHDGAHVPLATARGDVEFDDVQFAYSQEGPIFDGLHLRIPAGKMTAIVGPSGAGKTTILKLLLRFYAPQRGQIRLDGQDIGELRLDSLRRAISIVAQDIFLFDGTIKENLRFAKPDATDAEIARTVELAQLTELIASLPHGFETRIGQRGMRLSGGQRQRLAIARAVLRDSPILFFDEATSHVDNETEAAINLGLEPVIENRTTLVIAHRLSTIANADTIYVIDGGKVWEHGTHRELLAAEGTYAKMWALQQQQHEA